MPQIYSTPEPLVLSIYKIKLDGPEGEGTQLLEQEVEQLKHSLPPIDLNHIVLQKFIKIF